ncbi:MAG: hypothetical protein ACREF1_05740, partial [Acetobacteraceae bacterium]
PDIARGVALTPIPRIVEADSVTYPLVRVALDRARRRASVTLLGPDAPLPTDLAAIHAMGADCYPLALARQLDDAILHLRLNEPTLGLLILRSEGDPGTVLAFDALLSAYADDWLVREIRLLWKRVLKRLDMSARSLIALIEPGSCFAGTLAELVFAADRSLMLAGTRAGDNRDPATLTLSTLNFGAYPMGNGLTRLETRFLGEPDSEERARGHIGEALDATNADALGLVTATPDDVDWDDEVRFLLDERASFSPDALTGLEANLRFAGPETMETRIFGRLSAWQNWIFQRPNAVGEAGALKLYGSGTRPAFDPERT